MGKQYTAQSRLSIRHVDIEELREKAAHAETLSMAVKALLNLDVMEVVDIEILVDLNRSLAAEIYNALQGLMVEEVANA